MDAIWSYLQLSAAYMQLSAPICNYLVYEAGQIRYYDTEILSRLVADKYRAFDAQEPLLFTPVVYKPALHTSFCSSSHLLAIACTAPPQQVTKSRELARPGACCCSLRIRLPA